MQKHCGSHGCGATQDRKVRSTEGHAGPAGRHTHHPEQQTPRPGSQMGSDSVTFLKEKSLLPEMQAIEKGSVRCFWHRDLYYNDALKG